MLHQDPLVRLQAYVRHTQLAELHRLSESSGVPISVLVRQVFDRFIGATTHEPS